MRVKTIQWTFASIVALGGMGLHGSGQAPSHTQTMEAEPVAVTASSSLPDSPGALWVARQPTTQQTNQRVRDLQSTSPLVPARKNHRVVRPYETAQPLSAGGKLELSIMSRLTLGEAGATVFAAGFSHVRNSRPHYGTDKGAFGERIGALAIKQTSQSFFTYGLFAAAFHDDPRYYILGPTKPLARRVLYSAMGIVIARKDEGSRAINWPRFAGIAAATALTNLYYPADDHGFAKSADAFATSIGTSVLNNEMHEFAGDALRLLRHKH